MSKELPRHLSLSNVDFAMLRENNEIYVDKSHLIAQLASTTSGKFFLSRPRRFGKSLLLSTFESLFRTGTKDFVGLAAEKVWKNDRPYKVLRLDLSIMEEARTPEQLNELFDLTLTTACGVAGLELPNMGDPIKSFMKLILQCGKGGLVLLIDEYDAPLSHHLHEYEIFELHQRYQSRIFSLIKSLGGYFRFIFMTGVGKFRHSGIFSGFNFLTDLTMVSEYNAILGMTEKEVELYYAHHLAAIEQKFSMTHERLLQQLRDNYDGYCFSKKVEERIYNPWSVLSFLSLPSEDFPNFWAQSSGRPALLKNYLATHELSDPASFFIPKSIQLMELQSSSDFKDLNELCMLQQTGYLTIDRFDGNEVVLKYPNLEVIESMASLYTPVLLGGKTLNDMGNENVKGIFETGTAGQVISLFNSILLNMSYNSFPLKNEFHCRDAMALILFGAGMHPDIEKHNMLGRSDLDVGLAKRRWVIEFKYAKRASQEAQLLDAAEHQILQRRYGDGDLLEREVIRVAAVYSAEEKQVTKWKVVDKA
ncbi:AAA family ATPase [uncultured Sutterella sp.]|uniref:AAA family ATPase n=1 Tax=uncultured Sutterella sp. TaxID=286133 RepID=UPI002629230E|nr:AAA family ATPase [uncultured Sutterella sp.]